MSAPQRASTFSQNFFRSAALVDWLLDRSSIQRGDLVLDLGAGTGLISERLARRGCRVLAVEHDPTRQPYKVFSNIPFDATAAIVSHLTGAEGPPDDTFLVIQRE